MKITITSEEINNMRNDQGDLEPDIIIEHLMQRDDILELLEIIEYNYHVEEMLCDDWEYSNKALCFLVEQILYSDIGTNLTYECDNMKGIALKTDKGLIDTFYYMQDELKRFHNTFDYADYKNNSIDLYVDFFNYQGRDLQQNYVEIVKHII